MDQKPFDFEKTTQKGENASEEETEFLALFRRGLLLALREKGFLTERQILSMEGEKEVRRWAEGKETAR